MNPRDLDLGAGIIAVRHAGRQEEGQPTVVDALKTVGSSRTIGLPAPLVSILRTHRHAQAEERNASRAWADTRLFFATRVGTPLDAANRRRERRNLCTAAGVPPLRPNELRHTAATLMADAGVSLDDIAGTLDHANTRMLEATYRPPLFPPRQDQRPRWGRAPWNQLMWMQSLTGTDLSPPRRGQP